MYEVKKEEPKLEGDGPGEDPGPKQGLAGSSCSSSQGAQSIPTCSKVPAMRQC